MNTQSNLDIAISVKDIHKEFTLPQHKSTSMKQVAVNIVRKNSKVTQKVLDGVTFNVNKGDFFGIVGRNGSGKSTLLKLIAGVYYPTAGRVEVNGGLTPFIELGVGFNPELSGRDNVYLNGALLGFTRKEMDKMYEEIVDFAELGPFMDQKLKNYSSGMQVRLAFSIAIMAKNDVLIFDEVLAVGDEAFQQKCLNVFEKYKAEGQTVILVTHDMGTVRKFCNRAILLKDGKIIEQGSPQEVATTYSELNSSSTVLDLEKSGHDAVSMQKDKRLGVSVTNKEGVETSSFRYGDVLRIRISLQGKNVPDSFESVGFTIVKQSGEHLGGLNSRVLAPNWDKTQDLVIDTEFQYAPGTYWVLAEMFKQPGKTIESVVGPSFIVKSDELDWSGLVKLNSRRVNRG